MAIVIFCSACAQKNDWPKPAMRTTTDPCDVCGGWDAYRKRVINRSTGQPEEKVVKLKNFTHDARFLPGTPEEARLQEPIS
jgi:hypothetical protein